MGIRVENSTKSLEGEKIIDNISFEVNDGDFATLLTPSGEGKITLLGIVAGVEKPDSDRISHDGKDVTNSHL
jgi:ABC-type Fe3+/spermidine/putrescine transport system ATPase subunit